jgi:hypothetical protein
VIHRIRLVWSAVGRAHGVWIAPAFVAAALLTLHGAVSIGMTLDRLARRVREQPVRSPILLIGPPRTGSTFLHRYLCELGVGEGTPIWKMLFPSRTLQFFLRPLLPVVEWVSPLKHHAGVAHDTSLVAIDANDAAMVFRYLDGFLVYAFFLAFAEEELWTLFDPRVRSTDERDFSWLRATWQRDLAGQPEGRPIAKLFSGGARAPAIVEAFPDARLVYLVRDPLSVIPSTFSLLTGVLDSRFQFWKLPEEVRARYVERVYSGLVLLSKRFHEDWTNKRIPEENLFILRYDHLMNDLDGLLEELFAFTGTEVDESTWVEIREKAAAQRAYESRHEYDLARFGLDADRIRRDFDFLYRDFLS